MSSFYRQALTVLTSDKLASALDVEREDLKLRACYGIGSPRHLGGGAPIWNDQLLIARRLVEPGRDMSRSGTVSGIRTAAILLTFVNTCRCLTRVSRRWSRTSTPEVWITMLPWSSGASLAGPPRLTSRLAAITGPGSTRHYFQAAA